MDSDHVTVERAPIKKKTDLFTATKDIGNWKGLCEHLDVSEAVMNELLFSQKPDIIKKEDCLTDYFNNHDPDWFTVARVIANYPISNLLVACQIAEDHMGIHKSDCKRFLTGSSSEIVKDKRIYLIIDITLGLLLVTVMSFLLVYHYCVKNKGI